MTNHTIAVQTLLGVQKLRFLGGIITKQCNNLYNKLYSYAQLTSLIEIVNGICPYQININEMPPQ